MTNLESTYMDLLKRMEFERSLLSDHELRQKEDRRLAELRKSDDYEESEAEAVRQTADEAEDLWEAQFQAFTPASRITEADKVNDEKSHKRKLDQKLILLVKQQLGNESYWVLPQGPRHEGESMREAAERTLTSTCGSKLDAAFLGNAPCGFFKYKMPSNSEVVGGKVFFFKAILKSGNVEEINKDILDYKWVAVKDLDKYVHPGYNQSLNRFVLDL